MCERAHAGLVIAGECERKPAASGHVGASVYTERFNREQHSEETVTSVTSRVLLRARLDDQFSANFCAALSVHPGMPRPPSYPSLGTTETHQGSTASQSSSWM